MSPRKKKSIKGAEDLTPRQQQILAVIQNSVSLRGYPPTIREIGKATGLTSTSSVAYQLEVLEKHGFLKRGERGARAYAVRQNKDLDKVLESLTDEPGDFDFATNYVPVVGSIAAGTPITARENVEDYFSMPKSIVKDDKAFALRVKGDSMVDAGIMDGDWVIVQPQNTAENKEIVAALIDGEATVKYWDTNDKEHGQIWLQPANPNYAPIDGNDAVILGKVISLLRRY
ncbi:MAG: transcriptional repressor LexA [Corynebacterium sp.]|nr:transcriptional repressor LexA [Corynebacterium sp.]